VKYKSNQEEYIFTKIIDDEDMNTRLVNRIADAGDEVYRTTNVKSDMTLGNCHESYPEFRKLADIIEDFCKESSIEMNMDFENHHHRVNMPVWKEGYIDSLIVNNMWGIRAESGEITQPHNHWPTQWGFCYYIDPPEGCSNLVFPTIGTEVEIENGKLVIFQGHLIHEAVQKEFEGDRFSVAGTVIFSGGQR